MLALTSPFRILAGSLPSDQRQILRVYGFADGQRAPSKDEAIFWDGSLPMPVAGAYLVNERDSHKLPTLATDSPPVLELPCSLSYLADGDILALSGGNKRLRVLYRKGSPNNTFLVTERCDNFCLMCSQPPKRIDDDWIIDEILTALPLVDNETRELGFSGGEPTLLGERFLSVLQSCKHHLPNTAIHVLSNGRRFSNWEFTRSWSEVDHHDLMVGIPIYGDNCTDHDFVVQARGAFDETVRGILNLKRERQRVEIRVVIHALTCRNLVRIAEFIARNLTFVDHVALMGLEITGFTRANLEQLWVDPHDYQNELSRAIDVLRSQRITTSIYNHQLCVLERNLWPYSVKSISDWKNEFLEECENCSVNTECGGLFFSGKKFRKSAYIRAI